MSKTAEECKKEAVARIKRLRGTSADEDIAKAFNRIADALEAIAAAVHRLADVHLYVNDPDAEDAPAEAGSLPDGFRGMR